MGPLLYSAFLRRLLASAASFVCRRQAMNIHFPTWFPIAPKAQAGGFFRS